MSHEFHDCARESCGSLTGGAPHRLHIVEGRLRVCPHCRCNGCRRFGRGAFEKDGAGQERSATNGRRAGA